MITFSEAQKRLEKAREDMEKKEIKAIKRDYPHGLVMGSPLWYVWKDKIKSYKIK